MLALSSSSSSSTSKVTYYLPKAAKADLATKACSSDYSKIVLSISKEQIGCFFRGGPFLVNWLAVCYDKYGNFKPAISETELGKMSRTDIHDMLLFNVFPCTPSVEVEYTRKLGENIPLECFHRSFQEAETYIKKVMTENNKEYRRFLLEWGVPGRKFYEQVLDPENSRRGFWFLGGDENEFLVKVPGIYVISTYHASCLKELYPKSVRIPTEQEIDALNGAYPENIPFFEDVMKHDFVKKYYA